MTAILLIALIVFSSLIPSVFAQETTVKADNSEQKEKNHGNSESPRLKDRFFRIRNTQNGMYLSFAEGENGVESVLSDKDTESGSEYFRFIHVYEDFYYLNSAFEDATRYLTVNTLDETDRQITTSEKSEATPFSVKLSADENDVVLSYSSDESNFYIGSDGSSVVFYDSENPGEWILEEISVESVSMAYFETRMKLYSVQKFYAAVKPSGLSSFVEWYADNEELMLVSEDGTVCALSVGEAMLCAKIGTLEYSCRVEIHDSETFAWFSQMNITTSYWNGGALHGIKFRGRPFASETVWDWMEQGCALSACAMLFRNLGAVYEEGYDFRSGQNGNLPADPYTLALANIGHKGFTSANANYRADPVLVRWAAISNAFKVDGNPLQYTQKYSSSLKAIRDALELHPEGVVVKMVRSSGATHFVLFTKCLNPEETRASRLKFLISDAMSTDGTDGYNVPFEESASYKAGYRYSNITSFLYWDVTK